MASEVQVQISLFPSIREKMIKHTHLANQIQPGGLWWVKTCSPLVEGDEQPYQSNQ